MRRNGVGCCGLESWRCVYESAHIGLAIIVYSTTATQMCFGILDGQAPVEQNAIIKDALALISGCVNLAIIARQHVRIFPCLCNMRQPEMVVVAPVDVKIPEFESHNELIVWQDNLGHWLVHEAVRVNICNISRVNVTISTKVVTYTRRR
jgi:hypothetical protein